jgi:hypothetical protein
MKNRSLPLKLRMLFLVTLLCAAVASWQSVYAATITVTNANDSGPGSLRQALFAAVSGDTIDFSVTGTITLTTGPLAVNRSVTISGPGANVLAIMRSQAAPGFRIFNVGPMSPGVPPQVVIEGLTITNGSAVNGDGGGIFIDRRSALTLNSSTIRGNSAFSRGGGVFNNAGILAVNNSTISGNSASRQGGGICNYAESGLGAVATLGVNNSTMSGNASEWGGAIFNTGSPRYSNTANLAINNSTISGNSAQYTGGIFNNNSGATLMIAGTILKTLGTNIASRARATVTSLGYNLSNDEGNGDLIGPGDRINTDPMLGPLQNNGGPTFTHALLPGSPAIDAGDPAFTGSSYDQRGCPFLRVFNRRIDIGSFENQLTAPAPCPSPTPRPTPTPR